MLLLAVLFIGLIIFLAFYLNSLLDKREVKKAGEESKGRRKPL